MAAASNPHVVIIGAGFGGLYAARSLRKSPVRITLVDARNYHLFQPLLYQVATAALNPSDIASPIRTIFRDQKNVTPILARAGSIDPGRQKVILSDGELAYDYLIVATGAVPSYFGHDDWKACAPGLKDIEDARIIRRKILMAYESAEREPDPAIQREWLTFVIVGGGPTGVELAGALIEISRHALSRDFRNIDPGSARVLLLQGSDRILPTFPPSLSEKARRELEKLGVDVRTGMRVTGMNQSGVYIGNEFLPARTVIWAAGVASSPLAKSLGVALARDGRIPVREDLSVEGHPEMFVIGDLAAFKQDGKDVPGVAQAAIQGGKHAAKNIARAIQGEPSLPFRYRDKGMLAVIGRMFAVADLPSVKLSGFSAWFVWIFVHILYLIGFRNRALVLTEWAWLYFTYDRGARIITGSEE